MPRFAEVTHRGWIAAPVDTVRTRFVQGVRATALEDRRDIAPLGRPAALAPRPAA